MKKYKSITIALILLSVLASLAGTALAESSEPFPDEEWNRTYNVPAVDDTHWMEQTSDGGYVTVKRSRLVKFGGIKPDAPSTGIFQEASEANINENLNENQTITPLKKAGGFEAALAITILMVAFSAGWRRK